MNILAVSTRGSMRKLAPRAKAAHVSMRVASSAGELVTRFRAARPDLVVVDWHMPNFTGRAIVEQVLAQDPNMPILILQNMEGLKADTLAQVAGFSEQASPSAKSPDERSFVGHALASLHHPTTGRVDARRVAAFFGLSLAELARFLGRSPQAVHKTPDAPALQDKVSVLARIATSLTTLFGSAEQARVWLNAPNPDLDKARPIDLVKKRKAELVAQLLEDALMGHPG